ncbi:thioredoxin [Treponema rectale]|uniref:Thioredoxin n=1 Tax=Treponema rectale TaxID=744512 RepID=A0A840SEI0_9SPIR|nr:thioredoxin [Treponema rectale]MBB5219165.1 thioredoxin 1 [Treponema rectale]QOS40938.1 thioredoxin [Treponema rectale]
MVKQISESEFDEAVKSGVSAVDFSAVWCGPCKMLGPVFEKISEKYEGKINFYKVDVDEAPNLCQKLGIMSVPAVYLFKDGAQVATNIGFVPEAQLEAFITQ